MLIIDHRVNTVEHLQRVPRENGVEIDVRDYDGALRLVHDPFESGELLSEFLAAYRHARLIVNVKCDGLEGSILELLQRHAVSDFFFLDMASPTLIRHALRGERRIAVRFSEHEPIESALRFAGRVDWVWVDCFSRLPLDPESYARLRQHFKICLVSPELQGHPAEMIDTFRAQLRAMPIDAVCTDLPSRWLS